MSDDIKTRLREYAGNNGYSHGDYADTMTEAVKHIEQLEQRLADAEKDAERLDWLEQNEPVEIREWHRLGGVKYVELRDADDFKISEGGDLRSAINAAKEKQ